MLRVLAIAVAFALAAPTLAEAQQPNQWDHHHPPPGKPGPGGPPHGGPPPGGRPFVQHGPGGPVAGPHFTWHGRNFVRVRLAPFVYPPGWGYRRWAVGVALPPIFLASAYYYTDWATLGLDPPPPGFQWVRYGPDLLLVDVNTGQIADVVYGAFY
jgi:Ni/Co efflux regulator RcnB